MVTGETAQKASLETRQVALQEVIGEYLRQGYRVLSQTDVTAQLIKPKQFGILWFILWVLTGALWVFYLIYHFAIKQEAKVYIQVDTYGIVHRT